MALVKTASIPRSASPLAAAVLERLARERRVTLTVEKDRGWLKELTPNFAQLLDDMEGNQSLYRLQRGRYVVAPRATSRLDQAAPVELLVDLALRDQGEYYLGFLTGFIAHELTDLHSQIIYAAIHRDSPLGVSGLSLGGRPIKLVRLAPSRWPHEPQLRERRRIVPRTREFTWRSSLERTLVDGVFRPDLCAGIETVVGGWAKACRDELADWAAVWTAARACGTSVALRAAYLLCQIGQEALVAGDLPALRKTRARVLLDRGDGFGLSGQLPPRDPRTGLILNVPEGAVPGWLAAGGVG
jgi:predicted transcriptional regulator of viral defense system